MGVFKLPRATTTDRLSITPDLGELVYDTDLDAVYKGDGVTIGGVLIGDGSGYVESVTGNLVDNTDPINPIVSGVESVTGTGVNNTDPANPVISQSPYNLNQEGATDGQVLTWVNANNRYEPVTPSGGGSNWTLVGSDIYRDSQVVVGRTTFPANNTFTVQSKNAGSNKFLLFNNNAGSELFSITDSGLIRATGVLTAVGINHVFQASVAAVVIADFKNSVGTNILRVADSVVITGNFTANGTNHVIRSLAPGATILDVRDSGALNIFRVQSARIDLGDGVNMFVGTTTGTKFGTTTSQKIAFWNKTPIIQPTTAITGATRVGGGGTTITDTDTFGGYTIAQLAAILINTGLTA